MLNNIGKEHLLLFPILNMAIVGRVLDRLMSTMVLKRLYNWSRGETIYRWLEIG
jgi:hypothetical protein